MAVSAAAEQLTQTEFDEEPAPQASAWQLDFSSRPILDERGKKKWELLICDAERKFQHAQYFPNNKINSKEVSHVVPVAADHCLNVHPCDSVGGICPCKSIQCMSF